MLRFVPEICGVECGPKFEIFAPQILGEGPINFCREFINRHHFRPTGQVWLRSHGWSFIYDDEIKNGDQFSQKILWWIVSALSPLTCGKIWLALFQWPVHGKPGNAGKCRIFIGWVTMRQRISAVSG